MPEFSDEGVRRQMMHTLAAVGGFVMYADMLQRSTMKASSQASLESSVAIIQLGRALSRRIERHGPRQVHEVDRGYVSLGILRPLKVEQTRMPEGPRMYLEDRRLGPR